MYTDGSRMMKRQVITRTASIFWRSYPKWYVWSLKKKGQELDWTLDGLTEKGLYPITPVKRDRYLDKGRQHPVLKITREQLPLMPAFAMTAHSAQGQTFSHGAIVDLKLGGSSSVMASYVAITRVERREDLLIYSLFFPLEMFQAKQKPGRDLLVQVWRGEEIDWASIEEKTCAQNILSVLCHVKAKTRVRCIRMEQR